MRPSTAACRPRAAGLPCASAQPRFASAQFHFAPAQPHFAPAQPHFVARRWRRPGHPTTPHPLDHPMPPKAQPMTPKDIDRRARRRAGAKLGWYIHATAFVVINLALFAISHHGFGSRHWTVFPLLGWGLRLALHGIAVFMLGSASGLRERMVQKERERLRRQVR